MHERNKPNIKFVYLFQFKFYFYDYSHFYTTQVEKKIINQTTNEDINLFILPIVTTNR